MAKLRNKNGPEMAEFRREMLRTIRDKDQLKDLARSLNLNLDRLDLSGGMTEAAHAVLSEASKQGITEEAVRRAARM